MWGMLGPKKAGRVGLEQGAQNPVIITMGVGGEEERNENIP